METTPAIDLSPFFSAVDLNGPRTQTVNTKLA